MSKTKIMISQRARAQQEVLAYERNLPGADAKFLRYLYDLLTSRPDGVYVDRDELCALLKSLGEKHSVDLVTRRLRNLVGVGIISHERRPVRAVMCAVYTLDDLAPLATLKPPKQRKAAPARRTLEQVRRQQLALTDDDSLHFLNPIEGQKPLFADRMFLGLLTAGMRLSHNDPRKVIDTEVRVKKRPLRIRTFCTTEDGSGIAMLSDLRCARSLIAWAKRGMKAHYEQLLSEGRTPDSTSFRNRYAINLNSLLRFMEYTPSSHNLDSVRDMLVRLRQTEYSVDSADNPWFQQYLTETGRGTTKLYRFINSIEMVEEWEPDVTLIGEEQMGAVGRLRPIWYVFSFDHSLYESLVLDALNGGGGELFLCHPELARETSGSLQRLYSWMRGYLGSSDKPGLADQRYTMRTMHEMLLPSTRFDNFSKLFLRALAQKAPDKHLNNAATVVPVYGYFVTVYRDKGPKYSFSFARDKSDALIGDNSFHHQKLRQAAQMALEIGG